LSDIDRFLSKQLYQPPLSPEAIQEYLAWLDELERQNYDDINSSIKVNQYKDA
jgi:hypothetical protein